MDFIQLQIWNNQINIIIRHVWIINVCEYESKGIQMYDESIVVIFTESKQERYQQHFQVG